MARAYLLITHRHDCRTSLDICLDLISWNSAWYRRAKSYANRLPSYEDDPKQRLSDCMLSISDTTTCVSNLQSLWALPVIFFSTIPSTNALLLFALGASCLLSPRSISSAIARTWTDLPRKADAAPTEYAIIVGTLPFPSSGGAGVGWGRCGGGGAGAFNIIIEASYNIAS